jgi:hypothetical protein
MIIALMLPGLHVALVVAPSTVFIAIILAHSAWRGRLWRRPDPEERRIGRDEWVQMNIAVRAGSR